MTTKTLTLMVGAMLLAGSAALSAMSVNVDVPGAGGAGRTASPATAPAFSVVVTSHRTTPGHRLSGARSRPGKGSDEWSSAATTGHSWDEVWSGQPRP